MLPIEGVSKTVRIEKRESGFYWIKLQSNYPWQVAEYNQGDQEWKIIGFGGRYASFEKINETRILPPQN